MYPNKSKKSIPVTKAKQNNLSQKKISKTHLEDQYNHYNTNPHLYPIEYNIFRENNDNFVILPIKSRQFKHLFILKRDSKRGYHHSTKQEIKQQWKQVKKPWKVYHKSFVLQKKYYSHSKIKICSPYFKGFSTKKFSFGKFSQLLKHPNSIKLIHSKISPEYLNIVSQPIGQKITNIAHSMKILKNLQGFNLEFLKRTVSNVHQEFTNINTSLKRSCNLQVANLEFHFFKADFQNQIHTQISQCLSRWVHLKQLSIKLEYNDDVKLDDVFEELSNGMQNCIELQSLSIHSLPGKQLASTRGVQAISKVFNKCSKLIHFEYYSKNSMGFYDDLALESLFQVVKYCKKLKTLIIKLYGSYTGFTNEGIRKVNDILKVNSIVQNLFILLYLEQSSMIEKKIDEEILEDFHKTYMDKINMKALIRKDGQ